MKNNERAKQTDAAVGVKSDQNTPEFWEKMKRDRIEFIFSNQSDQRGRTQARI